MSLARSLLTFYELIMIPVGPGGADVLLVMDARQTSSILKLKPAHVTLTDENLSDYENQDGFFITTTIKVENMNDLRNARNALTRIVTGQNIGNVTEVPDAKAFVVTDFAPNVVAIYRLLREMDVPGAGSSTTTGQTAAIAIEHASAAELASVLNRHYATTQTPQNTRQGVVSAPRAPRITADERTNQLLLTGTREQIAQVKKSIAMLDVPVALPSHAAHLVRLTNIKAQEAANALVQLIMGSSTFTTRGPNGIVRPGVVPHRETNSLLISASPGHFQVLKALLGDMDSKDLEEVEEGGDDE
jgi:type II secretory pathway component GspD/PulD (secretin)